jgi:ribose/xylose/arabinose/galactoside ABC-type transport system permease subunit
MKSRLDSIVSMPSFKALVLLVVVGLLILIVQPLAIESYGITLTRVNEVALVAVGLTILIIIGEIDLSVGSTMAVAGIITCQVSDNIWVGVASGLLAGLAIGAVNGFLVVVVGVHSFIATLGTMTILAGVALILSGGNPVVLSDFGAAQLVGSPLVGQVTVASLIVLAVVLVSWFWTCWSRSGRDLFAIGGNPDAARAAGIRVGIRRFAAFVLCGVFAAMAGVLSTIQVASASPTMGAPVLLVAIASAVLGGGMLTGGRGSVVGAAIGALALGALRSALELSAVGNAVEQILVGAILFVTVITSGEGSADARIRAKARHFFATTAPSASPRAASTDVAPDVPDPNHISLER